MKHKIVKITRVFEENSCIRTFFLSGGFEDYKPGQFVMVWIPGMDEKPFVFSYVKPYAITAEMKGPFTEKLFSLRPGDVLGIRGPRGNGFKIKKDAKSLCVAGGLGYAPLAVLAESLNSPVIIAGSRCIGLAVFKSRLQAHKPIICTDDGSLGVKGLTTEFMERELKVRKFGMVYACGPEPMLRKVFEICERDGVECQVSLERYMFCGGMGICGSCAIGPYLVCRDGPVFGSEKLRKIKEFGVSAKLRSGRKVPLREFFEWRNR